MSELRRLDGKQRQMHFAGNGSKKKFQGRVAALKTLLDRGNCYLQSTTPQERVIFATLLSRSEYALAEEIKSAPIPAGVDEEGQGSLKKALEEMAQPFFEKGQEFEKLAMVHLEKIENLGEREDLTEKMKAQDDRLFALSEPNSPHAPLKTSASVSDDVLKAATQELHQNPNQRSSLTQLKFYYESTGNTRLAAYFQGRLLQLGEESKQ